MINKVLEELELHCNENFSGKLNLLSNNSQLLGTIQYYKGNIVECSFGKNQGLDAIESIVANFLYQDSLSIMPEPEIITQERSSLYQDSSKLLFYIKSLFTKKYNQIRPIENILVEPSFIKNGKNLSKKEFDILYSIAKYNNIDDIKNSLNLDACLFQHYLGRLTDKKAIRYIGE